MRYDTQPKEKIELNFFEDDSLEMTILEMLNTGTFLRGREYFIKDVLLKYFKENNKEEFNKIFLEQNKHAEGKRKINDIFNSGK